MPKSQKCRLCGKSTFSNDMNHHFNCCFNCVNDVVSIVPSYITNFDQRRLWVKLKLRKLNNDAKI
jgi:hypothetical protein